MADINMESNTINKALDIVSESSKETRSALDTNTAKGINKIFELMKSTKLGIKVDAYIDERHYKLEKEMQKIK